MSIQPPNAIDDSQVENPPRYRWLRRIIAGSGLLLVALLVLRLAWGAHAEARLARTIDVLRAEGRPVTLSDFVEENTPVKDDDNAVTYLRLAMNALQPPPNESVYYDSLMRDPVLSADRFQLLAKHVDENAEAYRLIRRASRCSVTRWYVTRDRTDASTLMGEMPQYRDLERMLAKKAFFEVTRGDHADAIETISEMIWLAREIKTRGNLLKTNAWASALAGVIFQTLEQVLPRLQVADDEVAASIQAAPRSAVVGVIRKLLEDDESKMGLMRALEVERAYHLEAANMATSGQIALIGVQLFGVERWLLAPMFVEDASRILEFCTSQYNAFNAPTLAEARRMVPRYPRLGSGVERFARQLSWANLAASPRPIEIHFLTRALEQMCAIALAVRLHELRHGVLPESLSDISTDDLPATPLDPFADPPRPFSYHARGDSPRIVSVGPDGVDDGGDMPSDRWSRSLDLVFLLHGSPSAPRSSKADENDLDVEK